MPPIMQAANEVVAIVFYLVLLVPCCWLVSAIVISLMRDIRDLKPR